MALHFSISWAFSYSFRKESRSHSVSFINLGSTPRFFNQVAKPASWGFNPTAIHSSVFLKLNPCFSHSF